MTDRDLKEPAAQPMGLEQLREMRLRRRLQEELELQAMHEAAIRLAAGAGRLAESVAPSGSIPEKGASWSVLKAPSLEEMAAENTIRRRQNSERLKFVFRAIGFALFAMIGLELSFIAADSLGPGGQAPSVSKTADGGVP